MKFNPVYLKTPLQYKTAHEYIDLAPADYVMRLSEPSRNLDQNAAQWPYLQGFSEQLLWPVNGEMCKLTKEEWKDVLTAAFEKELRPRLAAGFDGGVVMLGARTSKYTKDKFREWMEFLIYAASIKGVTPVYADTVLRELAR